MRTRLFAIFVCLFAGLTAASPAEAQYGARRASTDRATGETYNVEFGAAFWNPTPEIIISSESLGILGDKVDFVNTLGLEKKKVRQLRLVLRPGKKHKFRFEYTPLKYEAEKTIQTSFKFNGQLYTIGLPVTSELLWKAYRIGYEFDFVYRDRGFVGMLVETKYTDITANLTASVGGTSRTEFTRARGPIPSIGIIGRGYVVPNISITGEFSGFPEIGKDGSSRYGGKYYDFDLYGTVNFNEHAGAQVGYRSFDVSYKVKNDNGTLKMKGLYFGAVGRF